MDGLPSPMLPSATRCSSTKMATGVSSKASEATGDGTFITLMKTPCPNNEAT